MRYAIFATVLIVGASLSGCGDSRQQSTNSSAAAPSVAPVAPAEKPPAAAPVSGQRTASAKTIARFACAMHPAQQSGKSTKCPSCGMLMTPIANTKPDSAQKK